MYRPYFVNHPFLFFTYGSQTVKPQ